MVEFSLLGHTRADAEQFSRGSSSYKSPRASRAPPSPPLPLVIKRQTVICDFTSPPHNHGECGIPPCHTSSSGEAPRRGRYPLARPGPEARDSPRPFPFLELRDQPSSLETRPGAIHTPSRTPNATSRPFVSPQAAWDAGPPGFSTPLFSQTSSSFHSPFLQCSPESLCSRRAEHLGPVACSSPGNRARLRAEEEAQSGSEKGKNLVMSFSLPGHGYRSLGPGNAWDSFSLFPCSL